MDPFVYLEQMGMDEYPFNNLKLVDEACFNVQRHDLRAVERQQLGKKVMLSISSADNAMKEVRMRRMM